MAQRLGACQGGLLAILLLTDARRPARIDELDRVVLLAEQVRSRWDASKIRVGLTLIEAALLEGRLGAYQLKAAIAACHASAKSFQETDWAQIAALYREVSFRRPLGVLAANRTVAGGDG